jgi:V/A-type H+-transporting ATPase subunit K
MNYAVFFLPVAFLFVSMYLTYRAVKKGKRAHKAVAVQLLAFLAVCVVGFCVPVVASAASNGNPSPETSQTAAAPAADSAKGIGLIAAALATGLAGIGGGIAVAASAPAAIGATSEDPKAFGKALIFVALGEGIAIYGLLISLFILNKI